MADVLCYGTTSMDNIIRVPYAASPARDTYVSSDEYYTGGEAANVAQNLAVWGHTVILAGTQLGDDEPGRFVYERLAARPNLDLRYLSRLPGVHTPFCRILVTPDGERSIVGYWFDRLVTVPLTREMMSQARLLSTDTYGRPGGPQAARVSFELGRPVVAADVLAPGEEILPLCDSIVNSAAVLRHRFPDVSPLDHCRRLRRDTTAVLIVTDGPRPVLALDRQDRVWAAQPPEVPVVDATGAGDAFRAGIVHARLAETDLADALRWACAAAALKIGRPGAAEFPPTADEIEPLARRVPVTQKR